VRIRYCTQEIVVHRADIVNKMRRYSISKRAISKDALPKHVVKTLLDQSHLSPLPLTITPIYWRYDYALRLNPLPTALILADKYNQYQVQYQDTLTFNPGSFSTDFSFAIYTPSNKNVEFFSVDDDEIE